MKKTILILSIFVALSTNLLAQKMNAVKTDLFSAVFRTGVFKYERAFNDEMSLQLGIFYSGYHPRNSESTLNGFGLTPEFRFYLSETPAPNGTYLAPNARYMSLSVTDPVENAEGTLTNISFAINLGKQVILKDVIVIDAWVGPSYNFRSLEGTSSDISVGIAEVNGFGLRIGLALGIAF